MLARYGSLSGPWDTKSVGEREASYRFFFSDNPNGCLDARARIFTRLGTMNDMHEEVFIGIDVSKSSLDVLIIHGNI